MTFYMWLATLAYIFIVAGLLCRKHRKLHITFMGIGVALDFLIVLALQLQRNAVQTALEMSFNPVQQVHIAVSTLAVILYIPIVYLGISRFRSQYGAKARLAHIRLGVLAFIFRSLGFVFMFSLIGR